MPEPKATCDDCGREFNIGDGWIDEDGKTCHKCIAKQDRKIAREIAAEIC